MVYDPPHKTNALLQTPKGGEHQNLLGEAAFDRGITSELLSMCPLLETQQGFPGRGGQHNSGTFLSVTLRRNSNLPAKAFPRLV